MTVTSVRKLMKGMFSHWHICVFLFAIGSQAQLREGDINIVGDNPREGHVEVYLEDKWGTISTIELDEATPTVICRQKGFKGPVKTLSTPHDTLADSPEWNIKCSGAEESILDCQRTKTEGLAEDPPSMYDSYGSTRWEHQHDLWVICEELEETSSTPMLMIILDVGLSLMLLIFILCSAYLAYYCASRKKMVTVDPAPDPDGYATPSASASTGQYARCLVVTEQSEYAEAIEEIKLKDFKTDEQPDTTHYAMCN